MQTFHRQRVVCSTSTQCVVCSTSTHAFFVHFVFIVLSTHIISSIFILTCYSFLQMHWIFYQGFITCMTFARMNSTFLLRLLTIKLFFLTSILCIESLYDLIHMVIPCVPHPLHIYCLACTSFKVWTFPLLHKILVMSSFCTWMDNCIVTKYRRFYCHAVFGI